jgi:hypothetical protein
MNLGVMFKQAKKAAADNAPAILTAIGVAGTITTAVLASKAGFKAAKILAEHTGTVEDPKDPTQKRELTMTFQEKVEFTWKLYVPAVGTGVLTVACIVGANHISTKRATVLASAYTVSQELFKEYKEKVLEKLGEEKEQEIRDEIVQDRLTKNPPRSEVIIMSGDVLCLDMRTGRTFTSNLETIRKAVNDINWQIVNQCTASLTDFYHEIGLDATDESDDLGWSSDMNQLEVSFASALTKDNRPCLAISFDVKPIRGYHSAY